MARRSSDFDPHPAAVDEALEGIARREAARAKGKRAGADRPRRNWRRALRIGLNWGALLAAGLGLSLGLLWLDSFLSHDPRFRLASPREESLDAPSLAIIGAQNTSRAQILRLFERDFGRSVYLTPLARRRDELRATSWVKEATVIRLWPNRLRVTIEERTPVAFVALGEGQGGAMLHALIDADGTILPPPATPGEFELPVLTGVRRAETLALRREKVRRLLAFLEEIGPLREKVAEVDLSRLENLQATVQMGDHAMLVMLGEERFKSRLQSFLDHYAEIRERRPDASVVDVRLDGHIRVPRA